MNKKYPDFGRQRYLICILNRGISCQNMISVSKQEIIMETDKLPHVALKLTTYSEPHMLLKISILRALINYLI